MTSHGFLRQLVHWNFHWICFSCLPNTHSDFIELSNFNVPLSDRKLMPLCGNNRDPLISPRMTTVTSDGNFFRVTFKSNDVYDATGFNATYVFKPNDPGEFLIRISVWIKLAITKDSMKSKKNDSLF